MKKLYILMALLFAAAAVQAQEMYQGTIGYIPQFEKSGREVEMTLAVNLRNMKIKRQQQVVITPSIESFNGRNAVEMSETVVAGPKRYKAIRRAMKYGNSEFGDETRIVKHNNRKIQDIHIQEETMYQEWMREARFAVNENVSGCVNCTPSSGDKTLISRILPPVFVPVYRIAYVTPPVEEVKQRSETHVSRLNYVVGKHELRRDYKNNAQVLDEVDKIVSELNDDKDLNVTKFTVTGYASPEGNTASNQRLSENRAKAFLDYLHSKYGVNVTNIHSEGRGEDWDGLYKAVSESDNVPDKERVLSIINNTPDVARRKRELQALGTTYRYLLDNLYPPLRRNEYEIAYVARPFNVEEAKELVKTRPQLLSLNEMFLVANTYPKDSQDFKYVFDVAARMYPQDAYASLNVAAMELETGATESAIRRLLQIDTPEAWSNLGVAYFQNGDYTRAEEYLRRAAAAGQADARHNLSQFEQWKNND